MINIQDWTHIINAHIEEESWHLYVAANGCQVQWYLTDIRELQWLKVVVIGSYLYVLTRCHTNLGVTFYRESATGWERVDKAYRPERVSLRKTM